MEEQLAKLLEQQTAMIQKLQSQQAVPQPAMASPFASPQMATGPAVQPTPTGISIPVRVDGGLRAYIHFGPENANWLGIQTAANWIQSQGMTLDIWQRNQYSGGGSQWGYRSNRGRRGGW